MLDPRERRALCIWEYFYLARPDSELEGVEVHGARVRMGERLAAEAPADADLVLPIPDSGIPAAIGFARALGIPFSEGLIKNRYVQRTFIQPGQELRKQGIRMKYHPVAEVAGKRVVAVDDSIVRGNTTEQIVRMLFDAGATEVHVRISSPPVVGQCFYGIDLADPSEMIAAGRSVEEVRERIGATSLAYLSHDGLVESTQRPASALCRACLTGDYPTSDSRRGVEAPLRACALLALLLGLSRARAARRGHLDDPVGVRALLGVLAARTQPSASSSSSWPSSSMYPRIRSSFTCRY